VEEARTGERMIFFGRELGMLNCPIYGREMLEPNHRISGPAVIEQMDTTTVVHPEQDATVDNYRNLIVKEKK
ncbi:MAG: hydantoinase/oxoprolinase family protein, partial [Candidatus Binatia bacterium]